jgi:hypothetical protein
MKHYQVPLRIVEQTVRDYTLDVYAEDAFQAGEIIDKAWEDHELEMLKYFFVSTKHIYGGDFEVTINGAIEVVHDIPIQIAEAVHEAVMHNCECQNLDE